MEETPAGKGLPGATDWRRKRGAPDAHLDLDRRLW